MSFELLREAKREMIDASLWYGERAPTLGEEFLDAVEREFKLISRNSWSLPKLETYEGPHDVRRAVVKRFPYLIVVNCRPDRPVVVAIAHAHREPLYWIDRL